VSGYAYHIEDAPDPGAARLPKPDGGVNDLNGDECAGDGADPCATKQPTLRRQSDQTAGHCSKNSLVACIHAPSTFLD
jgi:hypothetical protein